MKLSKTIEEIRAEFPILSIKVHGKPLIYLDNGATTQKPEQVIRVMEELYRTSNANVHRGVHRLSDMVSDRYEAARETVRAFINAPKKEEIIFTAGTTASINAVAFSFGERFVREGDEIVISGMEHHANIVPWQMLCERKKAKLKVIPFTDEGVLDLEAYRRHAYGAHPHSGCHPCIKCARHRQSCEGDSGRSTLSWHPGAG